MRGEGRIIIICILGVASAQRRDGMVDRRRAVSWRARSATSAPVA